MKKKTKILLITTSFPRATDGSEAAGSFVFDFAKKLSSQCDVLVLAPGDCRMHESLEGISVYRYWSPSRPLSNLKLSNLTDLFHLFKVFYSVQCVLSELSKERIVHVFGLWVLPSGWWAYWIAKKLGVSYDVWALGSDIWVLGKAPLLPLVMRKVLRGAQNRYADGVLLQQDVAALKCGGATFLPSVRSISFSDRQVKKKASYRLGFLGRWHENKGVDIFLDALLSMAEPEWDKIEQVCIAGGGPMKELVVSKIKQLHALGKPVVKKGFLDKSEAESFFEEIDFLVIPSRIESIPVVFSDAIASRVPVICTPVGDLSALGEEFGFGEVSMAVTSEALRISLLAALEGNPERYFKRYKNIRLLFDLEESVSYFLKNIPEDSSRV